MERRRQQYARYSPVFWRPAKGVTGLHARFLRGLIGAETNVALRTGHGFVIAQPGAVVGSVDDFTVDSPDRWASDGADLLLTVSQRLAAAGHPATVRVVTAAADLPKSSMLSGLSLRVAEEWWVRELRPSGQPAGPGWVEGPGFAGFLGPAPPVYDPGGPVLHAERVAADADVAVIEREAAAMGAVLLVVPAAPGSARSADLQQRGWSVASAWYVGRPRPTG
jgi:hypothetical protein